MINITSEALNIIKEGLDKNQQKFPRIILLNGGCAGSMLSLILDTKSCDDIIINAHGIDFLIDKKLVSLVSDITICTQFALGHTLLIRNNALPTCKCGKSFKL